MAFLELLAAFLLFFSKQVNGQNAENFNTYYTYQWGTDHFYVNPQGTDVQLKLDQHSGAGFLSKNSYGSGWFRIKMKTPGGNSGGVVPSFFLIDHQGGDHSEVDFEFLGTTGDLQTNIFVNDKGAREQRIKLWFDPSKAFHQYEILWNHKHLVFFVDKIPIRVFKNIPGLPYFTTPMHIEAALWNGTWAGQVDWSQGPFLTHYEGFSFQACTVQDGNCFSNKYYWNSPKYWDLDAKQKALMKQYRKKYMTYDYCDVTSLRKPECRYNEM